MQNPYRFDPKAVQQKAKKIRMMTLNMTIKSGLGHLGSDFSEIDILASLYFSLLRYDPNNPRNPDRDYFILSKGHGAGGYYATLCEAGFFPEQWLDSYMVFDSPLPGHPVPYKTPGVDFGTGSLGHGLAVAAGIAFTLKRDHKDGKVYVLTGDGELQEGSIWETALAIGAFHLNNLFWIIDRNTLQLGGNTETIMPLEPLDGKLAAFGLQVLQMNGNDPKDIIEKIQQAQQRATDRPVAIIAKTVKGRGVSFMENNQIWHHKIPSSQESLRAFQELHDSLERGAQ